MVLGKKYLKAKIQPQDFQTLEKGVRRIQSLLEKCIKYIIPQAWLKPNSSDCLGLEPQSFWCNDSDVVSS